METKTRSNDIDKVCKSMDDGSMCFEMVIQRAVGQWTADQQSLLIDSILRDYKIPAIWITRTQTSQFVKNTVIDGNQRLHTIYDFVHDRFKLHKSIELITILADEENELKQDLTVELAGKKFSQLPPILQKRILDYSLDEIQLFNYTDQQIEEQFYRLNNGALFTKDQKSKAKLGTDVAEKIQEIENLDFWQRTGFSTPQRRHGEITTCILRCFILLTGAEYSNFGANTVYNFAGEFAETCSNQDFEDLKEILTVLDNCMLDDDANTKFLQKINIPPLVMCTQTYMYYRDKDMITEDQFTHFLTEWVTTNAECSGYKDNCGTGSTNKTKVENRVNIINNWLKTYINSLKFKF